MALTSTIANLWYHQARNASQLETKNLYTHLNITNNVSLPGNMSPKRIVTFYHRFCLQTFHHLGNCPSQLRFIYPRCYHCVKVVSGVAFPYRPVKRVKQPVEDHSLTSESHSTHHITSRRLVKRYPRPPPSPHEQLGAAFCYRNEMPGISQLF